MKRIAVSQRLDGIAGRDERRDAVDTLWGTILWNLGFLPIPVCNSIPDPAEYISVLKPDGILITGGNDLGEAPARDASEAALLHYAEATGIGVFGVCRGLQLINTYLGGGLVRLENHVAVRHTVTGAMRGGEREVNSYHNFGVMPEGLGRNLEILATARDKSIEAIRHQTLPWVAIMWHPEREAQLSNHDIELMQSTFLTNGERRAFSAH